MMHLKKNLTRLKLTQHLFCLVKGDNLFIATSKIFKVPLLGWLETRRNVLEKNRRGRFRTSEKYYLVQKL